MPPRRNISETVSKEPVEATYLKSRPSKAERNRTWESEQRAKVGQFSYRGIPHSLNDQVLAVAKDLGVPVGDVVRAMLEYGLRAIESGDLKLEAQYASRRLRLFPPK